MFYGEKDEVRSALHTMQRAVCCYDMLGSKNPPEFCDCKYGYDEREQLKANNIMVSKLVVRS